MVVFGTLVIPSCLEPILLLEQGVDDDELVLVQKHASVVIAVSNITST